MKRPAACCSTELASRRHRGAAIASSLRDFESAAVFEVVTALG
jgi:hypothetical protein